MRRLWAERQYRVEFGHTSACNRKKEVFVQVGAESWWYHSELSDEEVIIKHYKVCSLCETEYGGFDGIRR
ncbi:unnamed protein product [Toxocara canis]|uniref:DUF3565 domain-containing protein n=1 Tax=Toxocara canis TaxID=6265 RepID=A0A183U443_TOXCA|nr:unnamed protein product [Toxocara canis]